MVKDWKIGCVGLGFVGGSLYKVFDELNINVRGYDIKSSPDTFEKTIKDSDIIFLCLPAPTLGSGNVDISIYETTLGEAKHIIDNELIKKPMERVFCIKGTLLPGSCDVLCNKYGLRIISNPEFLTERTAYEDTKEQSHILLGGNEDDVNFVAAFYHTFFPNAAITKTDSVTAQMIKYVCNTFYATKLSYFNEVYQMCSKLGIEYDGVIKGALKNSWINPMHTLVPGPVNGELGFDGHCIPKDLKSFIKFFEDKGVVCDTINGAQSTNKKVRRDE